MTSHESRQFVADKTRAMIGYFKGIILRYAHRPNEGLQKQSKKPYNKQLINLEFQSSRENLKPRPCPIDRSIARSIRHRARCRFEIFLRLA